MADDGPASPEAYACACCRQVKPRDGFYTRPDRVNKRQSYCKACLLFTQKRRWNARKAKAVQHLGGCCIKCGFVGHPALFDFHHRDPAKKEFGWNRLRLRRWTSIVAEIEKCDLLCAMCHRLAHIDPALWEWPVENTGGKGDIVI